MRKKTLSICLIAMSAMLLTGCGSSIELTDEQNSMVAQYAAELLLKYDIRYDYRLEDMNSITGELQFEKDSNLVVENTEMVSTEEDQKSEDEENVTTETPEGGEEQEVELTELFEEGIDVSYSGYSIVSRYPEDITDIVAYVEPRNGMKLIVVEFMLTNTSEEQVSLNYLDSERSYRIILNDAKAAVPMKSFLEEDLSTLQVTLEPMETKKAVLIFQISESLEDDIQSLKVSVQQGEAKNMIILKE
ncbi:MAG: hypothetical protein IJA10_01260 [Lachnospiraceae bacterium]|nr:hypothetical protein [Lachnospiraceae bacterium]